MKLEDLKQEIPYKWKVQAFSKFKPLATCVGYIDARNVQDLLDKVCESENWQDDYRVIKGNLYAGIGIKIEDEWIWKWGCGVESKYDSEKGEASDAFKRAGVKWGVGRFLYSLKIQYVTANEKKTKENYPYVIKQGGERIWDLTEYINSGKNNSKSNNEKDTVKGNNKKFLAAVNKIKKRIPIEQFNTLLSEFKLNNWTVTKLMDKTIQVEFYEKLKEIDNNLNPVE